jgi:hypothetical protein
VRERQDSGRPLFFRTGEVTLTQVSSPPTSSSAALQWPVVPSSRCCVFCAGRPLTNEHAWPDWLQREIIAAGAVVSLRWGAGPPLNRVDRKNLQVKVKRACVACNTGWVSRLEGRAKPLLLPRVRGQLGQLLYKDQQTIATWAIKTAMMLQFTPVHKGGIVIADNLYRDLNVHHDQPPSTVRVWIGSVEDEPPPGALLGLRGMAVERAPFSGLAPIREQYLGFEATMIARHLVLKVMGHAGPASLDLSREVVIPKGVDLAQIWPLRSSRGILVPQ